METPELSQSVPELMSRHRRVVWDLAAVRGPEDDLVIRVHPDGRPDRVATLRVHAGGEAVVLTVDVYESVSTAYADDDQLELLRERLDVAVRAVIGPTRVIREYAGSATVSSTLVVQAGGRPREEHGATYPFRRLGARLRGRGVRRSVTDYPAAVDQE